MGMHRVEIEFFAPTVDDAEEFYSSIHLHVAGEATQGVVVTDIGMTPASPVSHLKPV